MAKKKETKPRIVTMVMGETTDLKGLIPHILFYLGGIEWKSPPHN